MSRNKLWAEYERGEQQLRKATRDWHARRRVLLAALLDAGLTHADIGAHLGISKQRAWRIARGIS